MTWAGLTPPYGTVVVDPPWDMPVTQRLGGKGRRPAAAKDRYSVLDDAALARLPVPDLLAPSGHVYLWALNSTVPQAHALLAAWGLRYVTMITWAKTGKPGLGTYWRGATEHALFAVRGWGTVPKAAGLRTWFEAPRAAHSVKPAVFYDLVEQVSPATRLELFQRQCRLGWDGWGLGHEDRFDPPPARAMIDVHLPAGEPA